MPITKSAAKALRVSRRKQVINNRFRAEIRTAVKTALEKPTVESIRKAASLADKTARKHIIHPNKAAHIKQRLAMLKPVKKTTKKT